MLKKLIVLNKQSSHHTSYNFKMFKKIIVRNNQTCRHTSDFVSQYNKNHIPTTPVQKILLSIGSATISLFDPRRAGIIIIYILIH